MGLCMQNRPIKKLYYSISDVSKMADVKQHVLRYWETEFSDLKPGKNKAGNRTYRLREVKIIFLIKRLLYQDKFTVEGARKKLNEILKDVKNIESTNILSDNEELKFLLKSFRNDLEELNKLISDLSRGVAQPG